MTAIETAVPAAKVLEQPVVKLLHVFTRLPPTLNLIVPVTSLSFIAPVGVTVSAYLGTVVVVGATVVVAATVVVGASVVVVGGIVVVAFFKNGPISMRIC